MIAHSSEGIVCISPSILIIASLGYANLKIQSALQRTFSTLVKSKLPDKLKEDILIFVLGKSFQLTSFRFLSCNFYFVSKVSTKSSILTCLFTTILFKYFSDVRICDEFASNYVSVSNHKPQKSENFGLNQLKKIIWSGWIKIVSI